MVEALHLEIESVMEQFIDQGPQGRSTAWIADLIKTLEVAVVGVME